MYDIAVFAVVSTNMKTILCAGFILYKKNEWRPTLPINYNTIL